MRPRGSGGEVFDALNPHLIGPRTVRAGARDVLQRRVPEDTTAALGELAVKSQHVNVVTAGAWAVLLASLTGQHDVGLRTVVSGRPASWRRGIDGGP